MTVRIFDFLTQQRPATPCLVVDLDVVESNYRELERLLPLARIYYAVKANPAPEILACLARLGAYFDAASAGEVDLCLAAGAMPERISFGNTIKKQRDIAYAYERGVRLFAFDSDAELDKLAEAAPGAGVFCRILMDCDGADWPLSRKFGCTPTMAAALMLRARERGLDPCGLSFHIGSQQTSSKPWDVAVRAVARLSKRLSADGLDLRMINLGGGFPAPYRQAAPTSIADHAAAMMTAMTRHFGNDLPEMVIEPGRVLAGNAGVIQAEVVLISRKSYTDRKRWVYLDIGKFGGLAETMDESIKYPIQTGRDGGDVGPVILAGPTCDSADILYEKAHYLMPLDLQVGDKVEILSAGAYTSSYASVGFNGFGPLKTYCI
ncbi:type III PLP-dependent enzyme [Rhodospirillaceae bacterium SYSU D60014]|uniref:type III PLP-dependent enzyme n=1 Tax=Virgifigura deserti TaxID=2268457 RepID=UPI000E65F996